MKQLKLPILMLSSALLCLGCTNYDRPQNANLSVCNKLRMELNASNHFHDPNATHSTRLNQATLMQQYKSLDCADRGKY